MMGVGRMRFWLRCFIMGFDDSVDFISSPLTIVIVPVLLGVTAVAAPITLPIHGTASYCQTR